MTDTDRQPGGDWRTLSEAATLLGKSTRTVRRYIDQGKLEADKTQTPMMVNVSDIGGQVADTGGQVADKWRTEVDRLQGELEGLRSEKSELEHELEAAKDRLEAEAQGLRSKVDRLALENVELETANRMLEAQLADVKEDRNYWRAAHGESLRRIPESRPSIWQRLLPWRTGEGND